MGSGFGGLASYLVGDESRVEWAETRNMNAGRDWGDGAGRDPFTAREVSAEMERRAVKGGTDQPMYHIAISFDPDDKPTDAELRGTVDRTLKDLGLEKHQALVVRHNDRDHEHVHIMVNRVGKDGKTWSAYQDRTTLRASMEAQERELGVRWTGKNRELAYEVQTRASEARARQTAGTGRRGVSEPLARQSADGRGFAAEVRTAALADLKASKTWAELEARLEGHGLRIERRGQGAVVTDGEREAKLSSVSRSVSRSRLEQRLGSLRDHERGRETAGRDRAPADRGADRSGETRGPGRPRTAPRPPSVQFQARTGTRDTARQSSGTGGPGAAGRSAVQLRRSGRAVLRTVGEGGEVDPGQVALRAGRVLAQRALRSTAGRQALAGRTLQGRAVHRDVRPGGRVDRLSVLVAEHRELGRVEARYKDVSGAQAVVRSVRSRAARALGDQEEEARQAFGRALGKVYEDPQAARRAFGQAVRSGGAGEATRTLAERPEAYGTLRQTETKRAFGLVRERTTAPAREAAPEAARAGAAHVDVSTRRDRAVAAVEAIEKPSVRSRAAARVRESPAVQAVVTRVERTQAALYQGKDLVRERRQEVERKMGRLAERIGLSPRAPSRQDTPGVGEPGGGGPAARVCKTILS